MTFVMSAGLAQIEEGVSRSRAVDNDKYVLSQTCFRHFDLSKVGLSPYHLSLFEMPGAFVFGSKPKRDSIERLWYFITTVLEISPDTLWVTYFAPDPDGVGRYCVDNESYEAWRATGVPESRLIGLSQNHWTQGNGLGTQTRYRKAGVTTEIYVDRGATRHCDSECRPGCSCSRFLEIANNLFISEEIDTDTGYVSRVVNPLTETVIGVERVAIVLQGVSSVFEIDIFADAFEQLRSLISLKHGEYITSVHAKVLLDHLRALIALVADGAPLPGKNGRERIIRLLIRGILTRAKLLELSAPGDIWSIQDRLIETTYNYPHLAIKNIDGKVMDYIRDEQNRFERTLQSAYRHLDRMLELNNGQGLTEEQVSRLVKQYGLPLPMLIESGVPIEPGATSRLSFEMGLSHL